MRDGDSDGIGDGDGGFGDGAVADCRTTEVWSLSKVGLVPTLMRALKTVLGWEERVAKPA